VAIKLFEKENPMTPELTTVKLILSLVILLTGFPIAFCIYGLSVRCG